MFQIIRRWILNVFYFCALRMVAFKARRRKYKRQNAAMDQVRAKRRPDQNMLRVELDQLIECLKSVESVKGDIAEVGVYDGGSALVLAHGKGSKTLHLFDTFSGLPETSQMDSSLFKKGQFAPNYTFSSIELLFTPYPNVHIHPGIFPKETGAAVENRKFSFVHLDVDTYASTYACLEFFYPRMQSGGIILSHDYLISDGVKTAFDKFFFNRPEPIIPCAGTQCLVVKLAGTEMKDSSTYPNTTSRFFDSEKRALAMVSQ